MKKFILLGALSVLLYSVPGYTMNPGKAPAPKVASARAKAAARAAEEQILKAAIIQTQAATGPKARAAAGKAKPTPKPVTLAVAAQQALEEKQAIEKALAITSYQEVKAAKEEVERCKKARAAIVSAAYFSLRAIEPMFLSGARQRAILAFFQATKRKAYDLEGTLYYAYDGKRLCASGNRKPSELGFSDRASLFSVYLPVGSLEEVMEALATAGKKTKMFRRAAQAPLDIVMPLNAPEKKIMSRLGASPASQRVAVLLSSLKIPKDQIGKVGGMINSMLFPVIRDSLLQWPTRLGTNLRRALTQTSKHENPFMQKISTLCLQVDWPEQLQNELTTILSQRVGYQEEQPAVPAAPVPSGVFVLETGLVLTNKVTYCFPPGCAEMLLEEKAKAPAKAPATEPDDPAK